MVVFCQAVLTLTTSLISRVRNHQVPSAKHPPHPHQPHPLVVSALLTMGWQWMSVLLVVGIWGPRIWLLGVRVRATMPLALQYDTIA